MYLVCTCELKYVLSLYLVYSCELKFVLSYETNARTVTRKAKASTMVITPKTKTIVEENSCVFIRKINVPENLY
jgi:hypothetical protein